VIERATQFVVPYQKKISPRNAITSQRLDQHVRSSLLKLTNPPAASFILDAHRRKYIA